MIRDKHQALASANNNQELCDKLLRMFLDDLPGHKQQILNHLLAREHEAAHRLVHSLKGSAIYCAFSNLTETLHALQQALEEKEHALIKQMTERMLEDIRAIESEYL